MSREALRVGIAGIGGVGLEVARRVDAGIPGLVLVAVAARDFAKARDKLSSLSAQPEIVEPRKLAENCDVIVEG